MEIENGTMDLGDDNIVRLTQSVYQQPNLRIKQDDRKRIPV
jgi:hypothetical protein